MYWRLQHGEFERQKGEQNRLAFRTIVESNELPGVLADDGHEPVGWCAVAPRERFVRLERSRILKPVDDRSVWSVVCFFVERSYRRRGVSRLLLRAAVDLASSRGAKIVEGYPVEPKKAKTPAAFAWTGLAAAFRSAGFTEVARRSETRPIMRFNIDGPEPPEPAD